MVVVEGVARTLNPNLNMWVSAEPVVKGWIERYLGPIGKLEELGGSAKSLARLALRLPPLLDDAQKASRLLSEMAKAKQPENTTWQRWQAVALSVAAMALVVIAAKLVWS